MMVGVCTSLPWCRVCGPDWGLAVCSGTAPKGMARPMVIARSDGDTSCERSSGEGRSPLMRLCSGAAVTLDSLGGGRIAGAAVCNRRNAGRAGDRSLSTGCSETERGMNGLTGSLFSSWRLRLPFLSWLESFRSPRLMELDSCVFDSYGNTCFGACAW